MLKYAIVLMLAMVFVFGSSCDKIKIPGNIAGQVLDQNGAPRGLVTVILRDPATGKDYKQEAADDLGNYFFSKIDPGTYQVITLYGRDEELPNDAGEVTLGPGKTVNLNITVRDPEPTSN